MPEEEFEEPERPAPRNRLAERIRMAPALPEEVEQAFLSASGGKTYERPTVADEHILRWMAEHAGPGGCVLCEEGRPLQWTFPQEVGWHDVSPTFPTMGRRMPCTAKGVSELQIMEGLGLGEMQQGKVLLSMKDSVALGYVRDLAPRWGTRAFQLTPAGLAALEALDAE